MTRINRKVILTNHAKCATIYAGCRLFLGIAKRWRLLSLIKEEVEYLLPSSAEGGDIMEYITWRDLIDIAALIIAIMSLLKNNKKR